MKNKTSRLTTIKLLITLSLCASPAFAANTWSGGGASSNWSDNNNWSGAQPNYGTLTFTNGGTQGTTSVVNQGYNMNQLFWNGNSSWTVNNSGGFGISLFDNGGTQAKVENQSTGSVTINAPITFAATAGAAFGEINSVNGNITFGTGNLTVNGSQVAGIKLFGSNRTTTFNNTVSASGKWFGLTGNSTTVNIGGNFTSGDIYVINGGTLNVSSTASITTSAVRLGGDFGTTGTQFQNLGGTLALINSTGGQSFGSVINTVSNNTSNALTLDSQNTSGTNTITGNVFLDSALRVTQAAGGNLTFSTGTFDIKSQNLTVNAASGSTVTISQNMTSSTSNATITGGSLIKQGAGTLVLSGTNNQYTGSNINALNANGTQINAGTLVIAAEGSLGLAPAGAYNNIQFTGNGTLRTNSNITLSSTRNISVASGSVGTFDNNGNTLAVNGIINGTNGGVSVAGNGTTTFNGNNSYTGATSVTAGTLIVSSSGAINASSAINVASGASLRYNSSTAAGSVSVNGTLGGNGTVGAVTISSGGSLAAGNNGLGIINTGNLTVSSGGGLVSEINGVTVGTGYDQVNVTGSVNLSGNLTLSVGFIPTYGNLFFLINNDGLDAVTGTFANANFANNQQFSLGGRNWFISYAANSGNSTFTGGNDVALFAIPEPSAIALVGLGAGALFLRLRRRKG
ncbi:MAG: beta strand repeat-containing protein [Terrimicrobiaceae bacterium]